MSSISASTQTTQVDFLHGMQLRLEELRSILLLDEDDTVNTVETKPKPKPKLKPSKKTIGIGFNKTQVYRATFREINWNSYAEATRALVDAIFDKETLANSSVSGLSRKGKSKRQLEQLDPLKVNDIVEVVQAKCVSSTVSAIRKVISKKCSAASQIKRFKVN